jgi:hypothetical protein
VLHDIGGKQDPLAAGIGLEAVFEQTLAKTGTTDIHTRLGHDALGFINDSRNQFLT